MDGRQLARRVPLRIQLCSGLRRGQQLFRGGAKLKFLGDKLCQMDQGSARHEIAAVRTRSPDAIRRSDQH